MENVTENFKPEYNSKAEYKSADHPPRTLKVNAAGIPKEMKSVNRWVGWRWDKGPQGWTKKPVDTKNFGHGSSTDPDTWSDFQCAWDRYSDADNRLDGVGFVFDGSDDICGVDWDDCRTADGTDDREVLAEIRHLWGHTELSPTGGGYHAYLKVAAEVFNLFNSRKGPREAYRAGRFFAVTGVTVPDSGVLIARTEPYQTWADRHLGRKTERVKAAITEVLPANDRLEPDDAERAVREAACLADPKFAVLHSGDTSGYPSNSEAVSAWLVKAVFYLTDFAHCDALWRQSGLAVKWGAKWDRLGRKQWDKASALVTERYHPPANASGPSDDAIRAAMGVKGHSPDTGDGNAEPEPEHDPYRLFSLDELFAMPDPVWLVDKHIATESLAMLYGKFGSYKSFIALDMALSVAGGKKYLDQYACRSGPVVYIAGEGRGGLPKRILAWIGEHGGEVPNDFKLMLEGPTLSDHATLNRVLRKLRELPKKPVLIVIDTVARCYGGEENSNTEVGKFIRHCDTIKAATGAAVLLIHHTGKDEDRGARGASNWPGTMDSMFCATKEEDSFGKGTGTKIKTIKQKDSEPEDDYFAALRQVDTAKGKSLVFNYAKSGKEEKAEKKQVGYARACDLIIGVCKAGADTGHEIVGQVLELEKFGNNFVRDRICDLKDAGVLTYEKKKYAVSPDWQPKLERLYARQPAVTKS